MTCMDIESESPGGRNLAERIRRLANGRNTIDIAQFQFIGLDDIRTCYGQRWSEKRDRVAQIARQFISKRIAAEDVLIAGADGFLLVFGAPRLPEIASSIGKSLKIFKREIRELNEDEPGDQNSTTH